MTDFPHADVLDHYREVMTQLEAAVAASGRAPDSVSLVAVSKTHPAERMVPLLDVGHRLFGENRVQEAQGKWPDLKIRYPDIRLHLIGPLQTNKVREAVALFDVIETVDRPKLAKALAQAMRDLGRSLDVYVQVNTGAEPQKAGILPDQADAFIEECRTVWGLRVVGLMCIPPAEEDPEPHFALLADMAARHGLAEISMGMSADYPQAIRQGATHVRVGTAIFGKR